MDISSSSTHQSGLDHLVEAATALTQLVRTVSIPKVKEPNSHQISDDEETRSLKASPFTSFVSSPSSTSAQMNSMKRTLADHSKEIFPVRLFRILSDPTVSDIITWLPHGRSFVVLRTDALAETVLPKYFPESCAMLTSDQSIRSQKVKYPSFTRKLNRWGFRQVTRGADAGAFHHNFFTRDEPDRCLNMVCQRSKRRGKGDRKNVLLKSTRIKPSTKSVLGPYSAVLRQPVDHVMKSQGSTSQITDCDDSVASTKQVNRMAFKHQTSTEDIATVVSARSCNTPPPTNVITRLSNSANVSIMSPNNVTAPPSATTTNDIPSSLSTISSAPSISFSVFSNNDLLNTHSLLQQNLASNAVVCQALARAALPQIPQTATIPSMPHFISFLEKTKSVKQQHSQQESQQVNAFQNCARNFNTSTLKEVSKTSTTPLQNCASNFNTSTTPSHNTSLAAPSATSQQSQQQIEAQIRVANAKNMLYKAFLQALG
mmetsp:Transcript_4647/g.6043  ORF Transcript_4647/g.6043 Transcript_4647/m.6043 type:complete len:486 (+) Transcript_4647:153-1610(+)